MKKGKINEAFKALDIAFVESDIRNLWDRLNSQEERKHYFGEYSLRQYALDRVKGTKALYTSLDKVIEWLVAKKVH